MLSMPLSHCHNVASKVGKRIPLGLRLDGMHQEGFNPATRACKASCRMTVLIGGSLGTDGEGGCGGQRL